MFDYFREAYIAKSHKLRQVIESHWVAIDFITQLEVNEAEVSQDEFWESLWVDGRILEYRRKG